MRHIGRRTSSRTVLALLLTLGLVGLAACDSRDSGPGSWEAVLEGPGPVPGAVVLSVEGEGVEGVEGLAGAQAWFHAPPSEPGVIRVVVVAPAGAGEVAFRIRTARGSAPAPVARVVELAGQDNEPMQVTSEHRVRIRSGP
jgi:hypothetical protein